MAQVSSSAAAVPYSRIRELAEIAMTMDGVLKLYFGESNLPTPEFIKRAAQKALADGFTYYTPNAGLLSTREAVSRHYLERHGVEVDPASRITITASGVQALSIGIRAVLNPGDEAIVLTPAWPNGSAIVRMSNAAPIEIAQPLHGTRYGIDFDAMEAAMGPRVKLLIYTSPSNPLGWTASVDEQKQLLSFARKHGIWLLADEVYERLSYTSPIAPSILRLTEPGDAVMVGQSFSKAYCMTGWRLGWLIARPDLSKRVTELNEYYVSHATTFAQRAGESALLWGEDFIGGLLLMLRANRDYCLGELRKMPGLIVPEPEGAFYLFPRVDGLEDSFAFCKRLLLETGVGIAPGVAFGNGGEGNVRICYAVEKPILAQAMQRLGEFLSRAP